MQTENYIYFFTACGFFIGLVFSLLNFVSPWDILLYTGAITLFFYLFIHVVVINFIDFSRLGRKMFDKKEHEDISEYFLQELDYRENKLDSLLLDIDKMNKLYYAQTHLNSMTEDDGENDQQAA
ncbi:MAG: hypothetical protein R3331_09615 [Sulfurospirillaceae bacterium]|nr:hypothetical protein [Sulfurospirillaceae bacterium]